MSTTPKKPENGTEIEAAANEAVSQAEGARDGILETLESKEAVVQAAGEGILEMIRNESAENLLLFHKRYCPEVKLEDIPGFREALDEAVIQHVEEGSVWEAMDKYMLFGQDSQVTEDPRVQHEVLKEIIECLEGNDLETAIHLRTTLGRNIEFSPQQLKGLIAQTVEEQGGYDEKRVMSVFFGSEEAIERTEEIAQLEAERLEALRHGDFPRAIKLDTKLQS